MFVVVVVVVFDLDTPISLLLVLCLLVLLFAVSVVGCLPWVFLLLGGMDSIVFGPIRWCVWSFRLSSPLRLPHLKFLFVCFLKAHP